MAMSTRSDQQQHAYQIIAEIGKGAYGTVYRAKDIKNQGKFVALKEIRISTRSEEGMPMSTIREIAMLQQLEKFEHPNIVRLLDVWSGRLDHNVMKLMLVFEHMDRDLAEYLEKSPSCGLSPDNIKDIMHQILNGVDFLHTNRIVHRDLKPQNILISSQGCVKIADFGLARIYSFHMALTTVVVTLYYRSPEVLLQDSYCSAIDIWSCGTILAELYLRKPLFQGTSEIDQLCKIFHIMGLPPAKEWPANCSFLRSSFKDEPKKPLKDLIPNIDDQAAELLEKMLVFDQRRRITCAEILRDPWFTDDADISTSSLSSSSMSLNTSASSSADNMDSGNMISTKKYTDSQQTSDHDPDRPACPRFIRVPYRMINGNTPDTQQDRVNDFNCARADRVPSSDVFGTGTYQMNDTHLQSVQDAIAASFNRSSAVSDMNTSTHDGSTLTGHYNQHCRDGPEANAGLSSAPVQFTNCQPNANKVQDAYRPSPINGNQFKEFYEPVTCNNGDGSNGKGSEQISAVCSHYPQPSHNSSVTGDTSCISSTSVSHGYQPPSNGVLAGSLSASMHHISESFRSVMTTTSGFQKPGMAGLNEHHQLPVTTGNHHQGPFQPPTTTATEPMANASMPESHHFSAHRSTEDTGFQGPATDRYQVDNGTSTREHVGLKIAPYQGTDHNNQNKEPALNNNPHTSHVHLADTEGPSPKKRVKRSSSY